MLPPVGLENTVCPFPQGIAFRHRQVFFLILRKNREPLVAPDMEVNRKGTMSRHSASPDTVWCPKAAVFCSSVQISSAVEVHAVLGTIAVPTREAVQNRKGICSVTQQCTAHLPRVWHVL